MENEEKFLQDIEKSLYVGSWSENSLPNNVLYVEEEENTSNVNEGILHEPLPAIDAEIMKGNSLYILIIYFNQFLFFTIFLSGKRERC
jgi:predicted transcriptional regulator